MLDDAANILQRVADMICGYPMFLVLIGGGIFLFLFSGAVSLRRLPHAVAELRRGKSDSDKGQISSAQALAGVVSATVGMGNIAGVAIALVMGGPGAIFWMWVSALVGMCTKYHEGVLAIKYRGTTDTGESAGGTMHIIDQALGRRWHWLAVSFAVAGMFGTLCIMNANQLTEAVTSVISPEGATTRMRFFTGLAIAGVVSMVVLGGIRRIARVATWLVPFMVGAYFLMVAWIIVINITAVPGVIASIFREAFNLKAGWGALAGVAIIGARRAAFVNDAGVGTATIMHGASRNDEPVKEGLIAMLGPAIDSGFVCTLTALAILIGADLNAACLEVASEDPLDAVDGVKGLSIAMDAFGSQIPGGQYMLMVIVACFAISSMFSYSFYGTRCASYLVGERLSRIYTYVFIATLVVFAVIPVSAAVSMCDLFYALMVFPTMFTLLRLSGHVRKETRRYFKSKNDTGLTTEPDLHYDN